MALLLAPYNDAMRLGMGFNSFTQQLCINDAVKKSGNTSATESDLHPEYKRGTIASDQPQVVSWTAKFVDRISEVTDSLNVSGSLEIKCDGLGGGGSARASFIDSNKFKESDLNYFIQVKVANQKLIAPDLTDFCPISHVSSSDFTRVYGDSFISGFQEGGEFNALISIKLKDRSKAKEISGALKINFDAKAVSVSGEAEGSKKDLQSSIDGETTISVSWSGGGDIKDESIEEWNLETLKKVAMEFPEHVMARPLRTHAILTKYSALRSFHEREVKGSPLEYENAGVYSSALLDAYMDYKILWRNIQAGSWEVEQGLSTLVPKDTNLNWLREYAEGAKSHYKQELERYNASVKDKAIENGSDEDETSLVEHSDAETNAAPKRKSLAPPQEPPMPPNELTPYAPTIFGLDKARRDCRYEMIKIVKEVDAVAEDPKVATDPYRCWQYLSPAVFKLLLPRVINMESEILAAKALEDAKNASMAEVEAAKQAVIPIKEQLRKVEADLAAVRSSKEELQRRVLPEREGRVNIGAIIWAGVVVSDENVRRKVEEEVSAGRPVPFNNGFFGCDPWPGVPKSGCISYRYRNEGAMRYAMGREGQMVSFNPL